MINSDLASRSCGYGAVFAALLAFGLLHPAVYEPVLGENFQEVRLTLKVQRAESKAQSGPETAAEAETAAEETTAAADLKQDVIQEQQPEAPAPAPEAKAEREAIAARAETAPAPAPVSEPEIGKAAPAPARQAQAQPQPQRQRTAVKRTASASAPASFTAQQSNDQAKAAGAGAAGASSQAEQLNEARAFASNEIISLIKSRSTYPRQALRRKVQGTVMLEFTLDHGVITAYRLAESSGSSILDRAALQLASSLVGFKSSTAYSLKLQVPLRYALRQP